MGLLAIFWACTGRGLVTIWRFLMMSTMDLFERSKSLADYASVRDFLYSLRYHGAKYGLERMERFAAGLGNPQLKVPCIHVAGTNGKGSVSAMLECMLRQAGNRVGLYTSPHLIYQGERIQIDRKITSEEEIVEMTRRLVPVALEVAGGNMADFPSFFEFMTAMAFERFASGNVDVAVYETGLGGRLDATNVVRPLVSVITSISLDHTQILGDSIEAIAAEKAGIIKDGVPVVIGRLPVEAEAVIRRVARERKCPVYSVMERFGADPSGYPETCLKGSFQRINAATATLAAELVAERFRLSLEGIRSSLTQVQWPGRWEVLSVNEGRNRLILDATHNDEGARALRENIAGIEKDTGMKPVVVAGTLGHDRAPSLIGTIAEYAEALYLLSPAQPRALSFEAMKAYVPEWFGGEVLDLPMDQLFAKDRCLMPLKQGQTILVTGSIYLIGEVCEYVRLGAPVHQQSLQDVI